MGSDGEGISVRELVNTCRAGQNVRIIREPTFYVSSHRKLVSRGPGKDRTGSIPGGLLNVEF